MKPSLLALSSVLAAGLPPLAYAQTAPGQVPAIASAQAAASAPGGQAAARAEAATGSPAPSDAPAMPAAPAQRASAPLEHMPPPLNLVSPPASLNAKEKRGAKLSRQWRDRADMPQPGEDGVVRFLFGSAMPTVVCAPLQVCDLGLQPGEIVNSINVGDSVRWKITPAVSGEAIGDGRTTHLIIKPADAGLVSSMSVATNRRTYAIKLVSTQKDWMPLIAFSYPDDAQRQWAAYRQQAAFGSAATTLPTGENVANLDFNFRLSGDTPSWQPVRVYTDGAKTYIQFPPSVANASAPVLVGLADDGGWFSDETTQMVNYRMQGDRYVVDRVLDRAALISGVGEDQTQVLITRGER